MDAIVKKLAGFGLPAVVLLIAISTTGLTGAAALTTALAALGPFGMLGGIALLGFLGFAADSIAGYGYEEVAKRVVKEQLKTTSKSEMIKNIRKQPITKAMKLKIIDFVEHIDD